ncbi:hypothetical protein G7B40_011975 [Aetokthonos hydrillicola Thurmond2011]|jgi:hypothetical protein|uniref:Uncharacterized protein n=1 Tax=Aetokthonos hydrillicola Thurmond2011 TaxID=2712845 RepID=A0AAP5M9Z4_9CYAN|nr:hypothetical protein [Aetokthonos hydrillicola]MBO3459094.1 hypothetical protein [Aetokthonos hydrillicola CCALA 1050]MBW4584732.1 hypothetical protein [Aetokthonos hydrillicola CCALA 1050]MDR9895278.1 hypothetical protein [Aetokthonos hydrillicola Thurmond2011]
MYKQIKKLTNIIQSFFLERKRYKQFYSKVQDVMIDALLEHKPSVQIKDTPIFFPADSKIAEIIYCLTQQLELTASWSYVQKNEQSYVLLIKFDEQECSEPKVTDEAEIAFRRRVYSLAAR